MTSWRTTVYLLFLLASIIGLSKGHCYDDLDINKWNGHLKDRIPLIKTKDPADVVECSLERHCINSSTLREIFFYCFDKDPKDLQVSEKCEGDESGVEVVLFHFLCMTAKAINHTMAGCEGYNSVCPYFLGGSPIVYDPTTAATPSERPTTTATTLPERSTTTEPTTLPERNTTTAASRTTNATALRGGSSQGQSEYIGTAETNWFPAFMISLIFNLGFLASWLFLWNQRRRDRLQTAAALETSSVLHELTGVTSQSNSPPRETDANGNNTESANLLQEKTPDNADASDRAVH